jgi:hypothetical protein
VNVRAVRRPILALALLTVLAGVAAGQSADSVWRAGFQPKAVIRAQLATDTTQWSYATFIGFSHDTLLVEPAMTGGTAQWAIADVRRLERRGSKPTGRPVGKGALIGAMIGGGLAVLVRLTCSGWGCLGTQEGLVILPALGGAAGALAGGIAGAAQVDWVDSTPPGRTPP